MKWKYTNINHPMRIAMKLSINEFCVLDIFYKSQNHSNHSEDGWAKISYGEMATFLGFSKSSIFGLVDRMVNRGFLEVNPANPTLKKATTKWFKNAYQIDLEHTDFKSDENAIVRKTNVRKTNEIVRKANGSRSESERNRSENERQKEIKNISINKDISIDQFSLNLEKLSQISPHKNPSKKEQPEPASLKAKTIEKKEKSSAKKEKEILFEKFWELYQKKVGKEKAKSRFLKLSMEAIKKILEHVPKYVKSTPNVTFRKHPGSYLNEKCWEDEIIETLKEDSKKWEPSDDYPQDFKWN